MNLPAESLLERIRAQTRPQHERLDSHPALAPLLSPALTREEYASVLGKFYGYHAPLEERLARFPQWTRYGLDLGVRRKAPLLAADLAWLGRSAEDSPLCPALPDLSSFDRAVGCLYVLEGSTLGGQVIARRLRASLGVSPEAGGAYFHSYGEQVGERWREVLRLLADFDAAGGDGAAAVAGAADTFARLEAWLFEGQP